MSVSGSSNSGSRWYISNLSALHKFIFKNQIRIVHTHSAHSLYLAFFAPIIA
jgi:hypothetical protein